ncbi:hypothetical protein [Streptomyces sp. NPDC056707]|uniref:hypothetical protein n=1 Tax=Streptomyces sp. NPDC056707 TaxID=3345919 RepID=UPI0036A8135B
MRNGVVTGRDFTHPQPDANIEVATETRSTSHLTRRDNRDMAWQLREYQSGLWATGPAPYLVRADHDMKTQQVRVYPTGPDNEMWVGYTDFARLLATDPNLATLAPQAPILLVIPDAARRSLELLRAVNDTTRRRVWAHTRTPSLRSYTTGGPLHLGVEYVANTPEGQWLYHDPHPTGEYGPAPRPGKVATLNNRTYTDIDLLLTPIADASGRVIGHWSDTDEEWRHSEQPYYSATEVYSHQRAEFRHGIGAPRPVPWPIESGTYFFSAHGDPHGVAVQTVDGSELSLGRTRLAQLLQRRRSRELLFPTASVVLISCSTGADTHANGLLHRLADRLNVPVYGPSTDVFTNAGVKSQSLNLESGGVWRWALPGRPELQDDGPAPSDDELRPPAERRHPRFAPAPGARPLPDVQDVASVFENGHLHVGLNFGPRIAKGNRVFDALPSYDVVTPASSREPVGRTRHLPAPWQTSPDKPPFLIHALAHPDHPRRVSVKASGDAMALSAQEFARLLAESKPLHDQPADVPVILVVPGADDLPTLGREVADATGRRVWTHPASVLRPVLPHGRLGLGIQGSPGQPAGPWTSTDPTPVGPAHPQSGTFHTPSTPPTSDAVYAALSPASGRSGEPSAKPK